MFLLIRVKNNENISSFLPIGELATEKTERVNSEQQIKGKINLHRLLSKYIEILIWTHYVIVDL